MKIIWKFNLTIRKLKEIEDIINAYQYRNYGIHKRLTESINELIEIKNELDKE